MLKVYNTLTGKKEKFETEEAGKVKMYVCGLTVQNYSHIGHIRSAINYDVVRRFLEYLGYQVDYISNFTDINEKIVKRAAEEDLTPAELADKYANAFLEDIREFNIKAADKYLRVSENIDQIIEMVKTLIDKGYAYEVNGNVYFSVESFEDYGKLSGRNLDEMQAGARIAVNEEKRNPLDFGLWKKVEPGDGWDSPWGEGWPGWHIECSAMSMKRLGATFDIHGGGVDLIFPHHENEIAQSEAYSGQKFVNYWLHNGTVNLSGEKMSKSQGNFFTSREVLKEFSARVIRYFLLSRHYRSPIDFAYEKLEEAQTSLERIENTRKQLAKVLSLDIDSAAENKEAEDFFEKIVKKQRAFVEALEDDFNTAEAIGVLHDLVGEINSYINQKDFSLNEKNFAILEETEEIFLELAEILGLEFELESAAAAGNDLVDPLVNLLIDLRDKARENKNWEEADLIRDRLQEIGIEVIDTSRGTEWEIKEAKDDN
ncbi:cysteinyl-tRNA synthetase [Halanaerobium saccharolyticum]|uniref:Cysteine--tRNA ligase n=1 Tax=Halanaerobium saccharolyticum TaxID=43595 RepID=A0A4R7YZF0_9FIRM|nr:cysteine--tRNA ligase [Halanaerobium saccharolyticum]RAK07698.1 cysteinyl-tRNA synthetase [Halanaerobium saccharolyticum]TDW03692.1 cysteinyl-tRNA synthetase [Halanaerobium saccharolyticum]TDX59531.1 cysteinyl-tRNA synthetase [Halanaerobium saccharolyticum]